jgi:hypothetical protein
LRLSQWSGLNVVQSVVQAGFAGWTSGHRPRQWRYQRYGQRPWCELGSMAQRRSERSTACKAVGRQRDNECSTRNHPQIKINWGNTHKTISCGEKCGPVREAPHSSPLDYQATINTQPAQQQSHLADGVAMRWGVMVVVRRGGKRTAGGQEKPNVIHLRHRRQGKTDGIFVQ